MRVKKREGNVAEDGRINELLYDPWVNASVKMRDELLKAGCEDFWSLCGKLQSMAEESKKLIHVSTHSL